SDMFVASNDEMTMLFITGAEYPVMFTKNIDELREKIKEIISYSGNKIAFLQHFSLYDRQDGVTYYGVESIFNKISGEEFNNSYIMYKSQLITNPDIFSEITSLVKQRGISDGDVIIKSNSESSRDYALEIIQTLLSLTPVFDVIIPEISIPLGLGVVASGLGISFDQLINGDTYEERRAAIPGIATNSILLGMSFVIPYIINKSKDIYTVLTLPSEHIPVSNQSAVLSLLKKHHVSIDEIPSDGVLTIELSQFNFVNIVKLNDEDEFVAIKGSSLSGVYYEVEPETGYEILSRRVYRTEFDKKIYWTRSGGLKGGLPYNFQNLEIPVFIKDKSYAELGEPSELSFINDDSALLYPKIDSRIPSPTPEYELRYFFTKDIYKEQLVTLMKGTTEQEAWNIANYKTAGGVNEKLPEIFPGEGPQSRLGFTEYTTDINSADSSSRGHFLVVIKVEVKYINNDNVFYANYWKIPDDAPVEVVAIADRRFLFSEIASKPDMSFFKKILQKPAPESIIKKSNSNYKRLSIGDIDVLKGRGAFSSVRQRNIYISFQAANSDLLNKSGVYIRTLKLSDIGYDPVFYNYGLGISGSPTLNTYTGEIVTEETLQTTSYWKKYNLTTDTSIIHLSNSKQGANGIKINLDDLMKEKPVVITSGELSGCTSIWARKGNQFYAVHTGTVEPIKNFTSTTGVIKAIEVLSSLSGVNNAIDIQSVSNDTLVNFLSENFDTSFVAYSSSEKKANSKITINHSNVFTYAYYTDLTPVPSFGTSVALLTKGDGGIKVKALSETYAAKRDGSIIPFDLLCRELL
ncbi:CNF1 family cytotoxic necrotizing factor, partial [Escherichia coli]